MDKSLFDKYIKELREMQAAAMPTKEIAIAPSVQTAAPPQSSENSDDMTGSGGIIVFATAVRGLYPIENARVTVFTGEGDNIKILAESLTDKSGKTPLMKLSAPSSDFTEAPDPSERPYAYYNIRTVADGYVETLNYNVAVFDDITSVQSVSLYPIASRPDNSGPIIIDEFENYEL